MAEHEHSSDMAEHAEHADTPNLDHVHRRLTGLDAVNFPINTEAGPLTDEYLIRTTSGFISARREEATLPPIAERERLSESTTIVGESCTEKGPQEVKLVTWKIDDPEDPRNWSNGIKWRVANLSQSAKASPLTFSFHAHRVRTMAVTFACFAVAIGSSIVVMDMDVVAEDLNTSLLVVHCQSRDPL